MKYTKEGIERCGEIWREGLAKFPSSPLLKVKLVWHHLMRVMIFVSDAPLTDVLKAGELARHVLASEHLSSAGGEACQSAYELRACSGERV